MNGALPDMETINTTAAALKNNGIETVVAKDSAQALQEIIRLIPEKSKVMAMTSATLDQTGIRKIISESGKYVDIHEQTLKMDRGREGERIRELRSAPEFAIGSVQAVTTGGQLVMGSNTGSQLAAYVFGAKKVIWVVGIQKIVKDLDEARKRIFEYVLPLESERVKKAYGTERSNVSKYLIINRETAPGRATVILVKERLGF